MTKVINDLAGDVFYANWDEVLAGATAVVSTVGGFGSEEQMQRINGEANVVAINAAKEFGEDLFFSFAIMQPKMNSLWGLIQCFKVMNFSFFGNL